MRKSGPWLLAVPLMLGGTEVAHWLAFRLVYPNAFERSQVLAQTGHGYFAYAPIAVAIGVALAAAGLSWHARTSRLGLPGQTGRPFWWFLALPPFSFALQEHLERLFATGGMGGVVLEPTFTLGVALTLPFGVVAYVVARLLLGAVEVVVKLLGGPTGRRQHLHGVAGSGVPLDVVRLPRRRILASGCAQRGPPARTLAPAL